MKKSGILILAICLSFAFLWYSCDDSGVSPLNLPMGNIYFEHTNAFGPLNTGVDGYYELWIRHFDSSGSTFLSAGKFNFLSNGSLVDTNGKTFTPNLNFDSISLGNCNYALVTIEPPGSPSIYPGNTHFVAGKLTTYPDSVSGLLSMKDTLAVGLVASELDTARQDFFYNIHVHSQPGADCTKGIWFSYDTTGAIPGIPAWMTLTPGKGWSFEAWVHDISNNLYYSTGKFYAGDTADLDGAGACAGSSPGLNVPGEEWVSSAAGCPSFQLNDGNHELFITMVPEFRNLPGTPYPLTVVSDHAIPLGFLCGWFLSLNGTSYENEQIGRPSAIPYLWLRIAR